MLLGSGCTTWRAQVDASADSLRARATTGGEDDVRVSAAVLNAEDSRRMLGADVAALGVHAIWIEVQNGSQQRLWLLRSGLDPDYFSPLEVAWSLHASFAASTNARIDDHFKAQDFVSPIFPGATRSGVVFVNPQRQTRALNLDLLGAERLVSLSLFLPAPDGVEDEGIAQLRQRHVDARATNHQDMNSLRAAVEQLPCCAMTAGAASGDPLNIVIVGEMNDIAAAVHRRGFRRDARELDDAQRVFARPPDIVLRKHTEGRASTTWVRLWMTSLRFRGDPIFVAQVGRPRGGRFVSSPAVEPTRHANVDEARDLLIEDMVYSGRLAKFGFVRRGEDAPTGAMSAAKVGASYYTDGLRAVLFVAPDSLGMDDLEILDWASHPGVQK
jgi:hypothetical protein